MRRFKVINFGKSVFSLSLILMLGNVMLSCTSHKKEASKNSSDSTKPVKVIFDTDMAYDWDDVGAMAVLHALADLGEAEILGMGVSINGTSSDWAPNTIDIINTYYGRPDIPIGKAISGGTEIDFFGEWTSKQGFPSNLDSTWNVVSLYRKLLSEQPDTSVVLISVGYLTNMKDLMYSEPDKYSDLKGMDLIAKKVKFMSCMGGRHPEGGKESNFQDLLGYSKIAVDNFPRPILFTSQQVGRIHTGKLLLNTPTTNPVRAIYERRQKQVHPDRIDHTSFDQLAVLVAIRDANKYFSLTVSGTNVLTFNADSTATNNWHPSPDSGHTYFTHKNKETVIAEIDYLMAREPKNRKK